MVIGQSGILCLQGIQVPRSVVQTMLKELDPEGSQQQRAHRLNTRAYITEGQTLLGMQTAMTS